MSRYRYKPFNPKPGTPGARIEWQHSTVSGVPPVTRQGIVWSLAPKPGLWVSPDESLPGDLYGLINVVPAGPGTWRSSDDPDREGGRLTARAAAAARRHRADRAA